MSLYRSSLPNNTVTHTKHKKTTVTVIFQANSREIALSGHVLDFLWHLETLQCATVAVGVLEHQNHRASLSAAAFRAERTAEKD